MSGVLGVGALGTFILGGTAATAPPTPPLLEEDARYRTKVFIQEHLEPLHLVKDDGSTLVSYAVIYAYPPYPLIEEFMHPEYPVDLLYLIGCPTTQPLLVHTRYLEAVPITICCIDKSGITGTKLKWTAENELRRIFEVYSFGSFRSLDRIGDSDERLGSTIMYQTTLTLNYRRTASYAA